jgi:rubrerythrin
VKQKKGKQEIELDWFKLSHTEYASGIEVYHASLLFQNDKKKQKLILNHALDEYQHSQYFYTLFKNTGKVERISSPHAITTYGGLSRSPFPCSQKDLVNVCAYLYVGEIRAIKFVEIVKDQCKDEEIIDIFNVIEEDENNHATGLKKFLESKNKLLVSAKIQKEKIKFYFSDKQKFKLIVRLQSKAEIFFTKMLFKLFPQSIFQINSDAHDFGSAFKNKSRMS